MYGSELHAQRSCEVHEETLTSQRLIVIDKMKAKSAKDTHAKGKSFCTCGVSLQELAADNSKNVEGYNSAEHDSLERFAVASRNKRSDKLAQDQHTAKHHFRKAQDKHFKGCATRWEKTHTIESACKNIAACTKP